MTPMEEDEDVIEERLMALADRELPDEEARSLRARIARDPRLAARYEVHVATARAVRAAFAPGPVPERLMAAILSAPAEGEGGASVVSLDVRRARARRGSGLALAASLALVAGLGGFLAGRDLTPIHSGGDPALAAAAALSGSPTGAEVILPSGGAARVLGSYETDRGLCRLLLLEAAAADTRSVVCRGPEGWATALAVATATGDGFLPASDEATALIDGFLDGAGAGPALDPREEAAALGL